MSNTDIIERLKDVLSVSSKPRHVQTIRLAITEIESVASDLSVALKRNADIADELQAAQNEIERLRGQGTVRDALDYLRQDPAEWEPERIFRNVKTTAMLAGSNQREVYTIKITKAKEQS